MPGRETAAARRGGQETSLLPVPPGAAKRLALSFVHQDLGLIPSLSILENLRVNRYQPRFARHIDWAQERARVRQALERLVEAELLFARGEPPAAPYTFKHALIPETAYQSLPNRTRQQLHALQTAQSQIPVEL